MDNSPENENSSLTQVVPNLYEFISSAQHKRRYFGKYIGNQTVDGPHCMKRSQCGKHVIKN